MLSDETVAVIGAGNIGRALIGGMIESQLIAPEQVIATRRTESALDEMAEEFPGLQTTTDNVEAVKQASVVLLTIKPQSKAEVITNIREHIDRDVVVISVLAGITTERLQLAFGQDQPVIRTMPNTPALVDAWPRSQASIPRGSLEVPLTDVSMFAETMTVDTGSVSGGDTLEVRATG